MDKDKAYELLTQLEDDWRDRDDCCLGRAKPCTYHEGMVDGADLLIQALTEASAGDLEQVDMWAWCRACRLQVLPEHHGCPDRDVRALLIGPSIVDMPPPGPRPR